MEMEKNKRNEIHLGLRYTDREAGGKQFSETMKATFVFSWYWKYIQEVLLNKTTKIIMNKNMLS